jgi:hypothetical protein
VAANDGKAVVGVDLGTGVEFHTFDLKSWAATSHDKWLPEEVSAAERSAKLSTLSAHQQAIYHFFWGEFAAAVELLAQEAGSDSTAETLFLLCKANDPFGLNRPDEAKRYAARLLDTFPESVFAKCLISEKQLTISREGILEQLRSGHPDVIASEPAVCLSRNSFAITMRMGTPLLRPTSWRWRANSSLTVCRARRPLTTAAPPSGRKVSFERWTPTGTGGLTNQNYLARCGSAKC